MSGKNTFFLEINAEKRYFFLKYSVKSPQKGASYAFFIYFCKHENAY